MEDSVLRDLARSSKALLLVQLQAQSPTEQWQKPEILLARAGFAAKEIAQLLGKNPAAVAKSIQRSGKAA